MWPLHGQVERKFVDCGRAHGRKAIGSSNIPFSIIFWATCKWTGCL